MIFASREEQRWSTGCPHDLFIGTHDKYDLFVSFQELHPRQIEDQVLAVSQFNTEHPIYQHAGRWGYVTELDRKMQEDLNVVRTGKVFYLESRAWSFQKDAEALYEALRRYNLLCLHLQALFVAEHIPLQQAYERLHQDDILKEIF